VLVNIVLESLRDPIWQIGEVVITLAALVLLLALRSPDIRFLEQRKRRGTRIILGAGLLLFLLLSGEVVLFHAGRGASLPGVSEAPLPAWTPSPFPSLLPSDTPSPLPSLTPSTAQVLTTFCEAINNKDEGTAWKQYTKTLQKERLERTASPGRITIVHCTVDDVSDRRASGFLLLKTVEGNGYTDGYDRPYQFTLSIEDNAWKITRIDRCLSDGCLDVTLLVMP
jgi:hypothetical protein